MRVPKTTELIGSFRSELLHGEIRTLIEADGFQMMRCSYHRLPALPEHAGPLVVEVDCGVILRMEERSWERAALRLGNHSGAGLTALVRRVLGSRPLDLRRKPAFGLAEIETRLMRLGMQIGGTEIGSGEETSDSVK